MQSRPSAGLRWLPFSGRLLEDDLGSPLHLQLLPVDLDAGGLGGFPKCEACQILGRNLILLAPTRALGIHLSALVVLFESVERHPKALVVTRGVGQELDMIRLLTALVAVLLEER